MYKIEELNDKKHNLLVECYSLCLNYLGKKLYDKFVNDKTIFWVNLYQHDKVNTDDKYHELLSSNPIIELMSWMRFFIEEKFNKSLKIVRLQFIINPIGSVHQRWHIDYNEYFSNLFIPLVPLNNNNSPQFIVLSDKIKYHDYKKIMANPHNIDLSFLNSDYDSYLEPIPKGFYSRQ